jgi:peptidoglycan/LPS O-acetylase OafA/YrhL
MPLNQAGFHDRVSMLYRLTMVSPGTDIDRIGALDGLRALAIALVLLAYSILNIYRYVDPGVAVFGSSHLTWLLMNGWTGVNLFLVLSGFLITRELIGICAAAPGRRRALLRGYALRRFIRVVPAYYIVLAASLIPFLSEGKNLPLWLWRLVSHLFFLQDYFEQMILPQYWPLAVGVQFYLLAPLLALSLLRKSPDTRYIILAMLMAALFMLKLITASFIPPVANETLFFSVFVAPLHMSLDSLLAGMAACFLWHDARLRPALESPAAANLLAGAGFALFIFLAAFVKPHYLNYPDPVTLFDKTGYFSLIALAFGSLLLGSLGEGAAGRIFAARPPRVAAMLSYGLYLMHIVAGPLALKVAQKELAHIGGVTLLWCLEFIVLIVLIVPPATVLYVFVEKPLNDWARRRTAVE